MSVRKYSVTVEFVCPIDDEGSEITTPEMKFLIENMIRGYMFTERSDGEPTIPFDDATLCIDIRPWVELKGA